MGELQELIERYCPDGVEYKKIGSVAEVRAGFGFPKQYQGERKGELPFHKVGDMNNPGNEVFMMNANNYISRDTAVELKCKPAPAGTIIFPKIGAAIATNKKRVLGTEACYDNNVFGVVPDEKQILSMYLYYQFSKVDLLSLVVGTGAVPSIRKTEVERLNIPVPPIEVQREIVRLLDAYTTAHDALVAKLNEEIDIHAKQFKSLCNTLICKDEYERKTIGELGELVRGKRFTAADYVDDGIGCIHYGEVYTDYGYSATETRSSVRKDMAGSLRYAHTGDVVIACTGENKEDICKPVAWLGNHDVAVHDDCHILQHGEEPRYMSYAMLTDEFRIQKKKAATESKVVRVSGKNLGMMTLPITDIAEQAKIADTLDAFVAISNAKVEVIEEEIALLDMQAEAFRNQILSFPEKAA